MVGEPERRLHCAHVRFHASNDDVLTAKRVEVVNRAGLFRTAEVSLRQRLARLCQLSDLRHRMPDAVGAVLGYANWKLEQPRRSHQRCASGNDALATVDMRSKLRLHVDYEKKRVLRLQAHLTP